MGKIDPTFLLQLLQSQRLTDISYWGTLTVWNTGEFAVLLSTAAADKAATCESLRNRESYSQTCQ